MPIEVKGSAEYIAEYIGGNKLVNKIVNNPFYTAILIVIVIILVILFVFRNVEVEPDDSLIKLSLRAGIYLLFIITGIQFIQNYYLLKETKTGSQENVIKEVFGADELLAKRAQATETGEPASDEIVNFNVNFLE